jgi:hypothetical protein
VGASLLPVVLLFAAPPLHARSSAWTPEIRLGYDYFSHSYELIDQDTTNTFSEGNLRLILGYHPTSSGRVPVDGQAEFFLGKDYWQARAEIESPFTSTGPWSWRGEFGGRRYRPGSSLTYSNDHVQGEARLEYRRAVNESAELRWTDRLYGIGYSERTAYFYDSYLNDACVSLRIGDILSRTLDVEVSHRNLFVPDSSSIGYMSEEVSGEVFWMSSSATLVGANGNLEWRRYPAGSPRSDFLRVESDVLLDWSISDRVGLESALDVRVERYESLDPIYRNAGTYTFQIGPSVDLTDRWDLKILPGVEIYDVSRVTDTTPVEEDWIYFQESYREALIEVITDYMPLPRFWCDVSARVGHRTYEFPDGALESDYGYLDLSFLAEIMLWDGLRFDVTGLFSPEKHRNPEDNSATNVVSAWVAYEF